MREWEGDASLSRIVGGHCRQLLLLKRGWHCPLLVVCHLRIEREREREKTEKGVVTVMPNQQVPKNNHGMFTCREGDDIEPTWQQGYGPSAYIHFASETSYYWSRSPTLNHLTCPNSYHAGLEGDDTRQGFLEPARSPTLGTMEPFDLSNSYVGWMQAWRDWTHNKDMGSGYPSSLPPNTHTHAGIQIILHTHVR